MEPAMNPALGYAASSASPPLAPLAFERRQPLSGDVQIDILFCGVCHSDLHQVRDEWNDSVYPVIPGHEIVGRVTDVGADVRAFAVGDLVGVGCIVDSCGTCESCREGLEPYCEAGPTGTFNAPDVHTGGRTYGGYSDRIVVDQRFVVPIPDALDPAAAAPLLCAGITVYSPLRHWGVGPGQSVGVVGLGGLGHMAVKIAAAMGARVVVFTTSPEKVSDARRLGAHEVVVSTEAEALAARAGTLDFILDPVSAPHELDAYLPLLKRDGTLTMLGLPGDPHPSPSVGTLISGRRSLAGSFIGGIAETREMLEFCAEHGIACDIELIAMDEIETAFARMLRGDVRYRFVIDMASLPRSA